MKGLTSDAILYYIDNPVDFVEDIIGAKPDVNQKAILNSLAKYPMTSVRSGHGIGKSAVEAWAVIWFICTRPYPKIPCTAPTQHQLYDILWAEISKWLRSNPALQREITWTQERVYMNGAKEEWFAVARTANTPDALQGFHSESMLFIIDEASGVDDEVFEPVLGALSTEGARLLMKDIYTTSTFGNNNSYKDSSIHTYLNGTFYNLIDSNIRAAIKQVKIPYQNGTGSGGSLATGSNGLSTKVFLLSGYEVGWTTSDNGYFPKDGVRLAYFGNSSGGNSKRIAYNGSSAAIWWLRSPYTSNYSYVWLVGTGGSSGGWYHNSYGVRPAFILPSTLVVSDDGTVSVNTAPTVSTDGTALGQKNAAFAWKYTVRDADGDTLTVTEKLDGKTTKTRTGVASGTALTFEQTASAAGFQKILNGNHTITVEVSDGKETVSTSATFTKAVHAASVTLTTPLAVDGDITVAVLQVTGSIPDDATFKVEVTNNANDPSPVWQDATVEVKKGVNIVFTNSEATNGAAFNFRVSVSRGASGTGGYIEAITGAFQ